MRLLIARLPRSVRHYATTSSTVQGGNYTSALGQRHRADWRQFHFQRGIEGARLSPFTRAARGWRLAMTMSGPAPQARGD
jgi:hypothetical protein